MEKKEKQVQLITESEIKQRVVYIGEAINEDIFLERGAVLVCVQKGAAPFCADLQRELEGDIRIKNIKVSSYVGKQSTGKIKVKEFENMHDIVDKVVIIVEDIMDTGRTLQFLKEYLKKYNPKEIKVAAFLDKREKRDKDVTLKLDYTGFVIPDYFVIGYGLDFDEKYRHFRDIRLITKKLSFIERLKIRRGIKKQINSPVRTNTTKTEDEIREAYLNRNTKKIGKNLKELYEAKSKKKEDNSILSIAKDANDAEKRRNFTTGFAIANMFVCTFLINYLSQKYGPLSLQRIAVSAAAFFSAPLALSCDQETDEEITKLNYKAKSLMLKNGIYTHIFESEKDAFDNSIVRERRKAIKRLEKLKYSKIK